VTAAPLPVERRGDSNADDLLQSGLPDDDDDDDGDDDGGDPDMTSFGSGYHDNGYYDNDAHAAGDETVKPRHNHMVSGSSGGGDGGVGVGVGGGSSVYDVWPPAAASSSSSSDRQLDDLRPSDGLARTLSTTPAVARTLSRDLVPRGPDGVAPTRRGAVVERRRPAAVGRPSTLSSSSSSAARRHHYGDSASRGTSSSRHHVVTAAAAAILLCSAHVFLQFPVTRSPLC